MSQIDLAKINAASMVQMTDDEREVYLMDHPDSTEEIPVIDIGAYRAGVPGAREQVAHQLRDVTENVGFFYLAGHGIPERLVADIFEQSLHFHAQPQEVKGTIPYVSNDTFLSGYQPAAPRAPRRQASILLQT